MKERRQYSDELKAEAVKMVTRDGPTHAEVARKLGIPKGSIGNLVAALKEDTPAAWPAASSMTEVLAENARLRKELVHWPSGRPCDTGGLRRDTFTIPTEGTSIAPTHTRISSGGPE